jgi:hypothetical protein
MDTDTSRTRRLVRWLKDKIEKRQNDKDDHDPWWVTLMLDVGRPAVAIMILTMCAPGEHYLMLEARFSDPFAWLGPGTLTAYAGIAAVTATKRPKGSPGHKTAVLGAVLSIAIAMAAQPIAHLWGVQGITTERVWLIIVVSSVPSAVFGHLLHMGAAPTMKRRTPRADRKRDKAPDKPAPSWVTEGKVHAQLSRASVSGAGQTGGQEPDTDRDSMTDTDTRGVRRMSGGSMKSFALSKIMDNPAVTDTELTDAIKESFGQDSKANSIYVAIKRARREAAA